ncbi:MAG: type II toxin-antitoxin system VapC family toxin [Chloroflexi bacterium]|nr:type II toxin-antitoxin system VapC family toxin [Chloroflexota bacterium]MCC6892787.1 type II toxin-antitoxin system VapC family toxin [Anaerolineae bacterium]
MTTYYIDTSGLAKYYIPEVGTSWVRTLIRPSTNAVVVFSDATVVEMYSLINRRHKMGHLTSAMVNALQPAVLSHISTRYLVEPIDSTTFVQARTLVAKHDLRTLDALQLSAAISAAHTLNEVLTFISADVHLLAAAQAEGFIVDNPNNHP